MKQINEFKIISVVVIIVCVAITSTGRACLGSEHTMLLRVPLISSDKNTRIQCIIKELREFLKGLGISNRAINSTEIGKLANAIYNAQTGTGDGEEVVVNLDGINLKRLGIPQSYNIAKLKKQLGKIGLTETMTKRGFIIRAVSLGFSVGLLPVALRGDKNVKEESHSEPISEKPTYSYGDLRLLEEITQQLEIAIKNYYDEVTRLSKEKEDFDDAKALMDTVAQPVANILNTYKEIPQIRSGIARLSIDEISNLSLEKGIDILAKYYSSFGKYFHMGRISDSLNGRFIPGLYNFILADIGQVPDGAGLTYADKKLQVKEIALDKVRIDFLFDYPAWADFKNNIIIYNLDKFKKSAERAWELINQYPTILTLDAILELIKQDEAEKLSEGAFASLYLKEFGVDNTKEHFLDKFIKASCMVDGMHELTHLVFKKRYYSEPDTQIASIQSEFDSYWKPLGYSGHPYLALTALLKAALVKTDAVMPDFEQPHFIACNEAINFIVDYARSRTTKISTVEPKWASPRQLGLFYVSQLHLLTRDQITEIGKTPVELDRQQFKMQEYMRDMRSSS